MKKCHENFFLEATMAMQPVMESLSGVSLSSEDHADNPHYPFLIQPDSTTVTNTKTEEKAVVTEKLDSFLNEGTI